MDTKLIKQKILDLAIRGKLVPQNPADEPASVLLERIKAEKAQLIKEGKIKKEKPLAPIEDVPFEIPESWEWCRLGEIAKFINGRAYKKEELLSEGKYKVLRVGNFFTNESWYYSNLELDADKYCCKGDLLYAWSASFGPKIWDEEKTIFHYHIWNVKFSSSNINKKYLFYFLEFDKNRLKGDTTGSTMIHIAMEHMIPRLFPLPPLEEQKRIVAEIERWFKWIDELEKNQQDLHTAIQQAKSKILDLAIHGKLVPQDANDEPASILLERIKTERAQLIKERKIKKEKPLAPIEEVPFEIPESWEWCRLSEIGNWQSGGTPSRSNKSYYEGSIPWLKTGDLNDGFITSIPESISEEAVANSSAKLNPENSVLIAMYGATIGKVGILTFPATTNQACCACSYYKPVEMLYLFYFLLSQKNAFIAKGGGGAQPNISKEIIVKTEFPLPPLEEQKRIVSKIEELFTHIDKIEESLNR